MANIRAFQACDASSILAARTMKLSLKQILYKRIFQAAEG